MNHISKSLLIYVYFIPRDEGLVWNILAFTAEHHGIHIPGPLHILGPFLHVLLNIFCDIELLDILFGMPSNL